MGKVLSLLALGLVLLGCDDAEFRPAKNAKEHPAEKDAYRIHDAQELDVGCIKLGVIHTGAREAPLEAIAQTAARHGGTHYIVRDEQHFVRESYSGTYGNGAFNMHKNVERTRAMWAEVYRCKS